MKFRLMLAAATLALLGGCATYDYTGGQSGGYYRGTPTTQYRYPPGYGGYGGVPYYGGAGWIGLYDYPVYPAYRGGYYYRPGYYPHPGYRPPRRPDNRPGGHRPPPTRPGNLQPSRPSRPPTAPPRPSRPPASTPRPPSNNRGGSPWRNMDRLRPSRPAQQER